MSKGGHMTLVMLQQVRKWAVPGSPCRVEAEEGLEVVSADASLGLCLSSCPATFQHVEGSPALHLGPLYQAWSFQASWSRKRRL